MIDIAQHIEYLLLHHDCVVVPGLGAFIINDESACYDSDSHLFMPPSRTLGFNPEVRHNDAMLIGSISRRNSISISAARAELETEVSSLHHQLELTGEFPLGTLGMLMRGDSPEYPVFEPSADSLPFAVGRSLKPVNCEPLAEQVENGDEDDTRPHVVIIPTLLKVVASFIVVMVVFGVLYSTTGLINSPRINSASLDTGLSSKIEQSVPAMESVVDENISREIVLNIALPDVRNDCCKAAEIASPGRYLLVVGSFPNLASAKRHIAWIGDPTLKVIEMDGNFRIYAASSPNIMEARQLAVSLSETYPNVWICRR